MYYVNQETNAQVHINDLRQMFPSMALPDGGSASHVGYLLLRTTNRPTPLPWHHVSEAPPISNVQQWAQVPMGEDEIEALFSAALDEFYDIKAAERRYANRVTCTLRAGYPGPFHAEGVAFATWMDSCNAYCYSVMAAVKSGQRAMPTIEGLIQELPEMVWPA